jgi:crossover junction endodeoxyribonuclease RuvC
MIYLGVDPGLTGALAFVQTDDDGSVAGVEVHDAPVFQISRNGRQNTSQLNIHATSELLVCRPVVYAVIEQVGPMPKQGVASAFTFGRVYGQLEALVAATSISYELVQPNAWKQRFQLTGKDKDASRETATRLFPTAAESFKRKADDGRAEAALLGLVAMTLSSRMKEADGWR